MAEFDIIARHFSALGSTRDDETLGVGDDAALLSPGPGMALRVSAVSVDATGPCESVARDAVEKSARAIHDAGAHPAWATLALTLSRVDESWLRGFAAALHDALSRHGVALVGGDTTRGPDTVTLHLIGVCDAAHAGDQP